MQTERCGNCRFLEPTALVCRRYPPTIAVIDGKEVSFHLVVFADIGWCGEWQAERIRASRVGIDR